MVLLCRTWTTLSLVIMQTVSLETVVMNIQYSILGTRPSPNMFLLFYNSYERRHRTIRTMYLDLYARRRDHQTVKTFQIRLCEENCNVSGFSFAWVRGFCSPRRYAVCIFTFPPNASILPIHTQAMLERS